MKKRISRIIGVGVTLALLTSLFVMAIPASALSQPTVSIDLYENVISTANAGYTIIFTLGKELGQYDRITVTFPYDTGVATSLTAPSISASPGWIGGQYASANLTALNWTTSATYRTVSVNMTAATDGIGEGATVRISLPDGITNPSSPADYTLTVGTTSGAATTIEAAVTSAAYTIVTPYPTYLPGVVDIYNPAGILMTSKTGDTALGAAAVAAGQGYTIKVGPGVYAATDPLVPSARGQTWIATGDAAATIVTGGVTVGQHDCVIEGLTLKGGVTVTGDDSAIKNCVFSKSGTSTTTTTETLLTLNNTSDPLDTYPGGMISGCTFDTTLGAVVDTGVSVSATAAGGLVLSGCTFSVDSTTGGTPDTAIINVGSSGLGVVTLPGVTVSGCTITGASGEGIEATAGITSVAGSTLSGLFTALDIDGGSIYVDTSTISGCGAAISSTLPAGNAAIAVAGATLVQITNSAITGSLNDIMQVEANGNNVYVLFNDLSGNAKGIDNNDTINAVTATHNWWGDPSGPSTTFNAGLVTYLPVIAGQATGSFATGASSLIKKTTVGVDVTVSGGTGTMGIVGVANYAANPQDATPDPALAGGFYDVLVSSPATTISEITLKFYNANITTNSLVYVWSELMGAWALCAPTSALAAASQGVNLFGGYAWVKITSGTVPAITDLAGTEFAIVEPAEAEPALAVAVTKPTFGDQEVSIRPTFTWTAAADATGYEFVLAEELGLDDPFQIIDYSATSTTNGHVAREDLKYSTTYWWRVRASSATATGDWVVSFFTTEAEPEEALPPVVVEEKEVPAPVITVEIPPAVEKVTQAIPDWALYTIIAVAAVLIIAVIVLIVRTRRVA
jgi:hypothetical protein